MDLWKDIPRTLRPPAIGSMAMAAMIVVMRWGHDHHPESVAFFWLVCFVALPIVVLAYYRDARERPYRRLRPRILDAMHELGPGPFALTVIAAKAGITVEDLERTIPLMKGYAFRHPTLGMFVIDY